MADIARAIEIDSEDEAWKCLAALVRGTLLVDRDTEFEVSRWAKFTLKVTGETSSISASMMGGLVETQKAFLRSYGAIQYGSNDLRKITDEERAALELRVKVKKGSSILEIDWQQLLEKIFEVAINKMDPISVVIIILGLGVTFAGTSSFKSYLEHRRKTRLDELASNERRQQLEHAQFTSEQETKRMTILKEAIKQEPVLREVKKQGDIAKAAILYGMQTAPLVEIDSIQIDAELAEELSRTARRRSEEVTIGGTYVVLRVDATSPEGFKVRLEDIDTGDEVTAIVGDAIKFEKARNNIQRVEWSKGRIKVRCVIHAMTIGDEVRSAEIIQAELVEKVRTR